MSPAGVVAHSSPWTPAAYEPHEGLLPRLFGLRPCDRKQCGRLLPPVSMTQSWKISSWNLLISTLVDFSCPARPTLHYFSLVFTRVARLSMLRRLTAIQSPPLPGTVFSSSLTTYLGEELVYLSDFASSGRISLTVFSIGAVALSLPTHTMRMLIPATCACSLAFVLPVATPPRQLCLHQQVC